MLCIGVHYGKNHKEQYFVVRIVRFFPPSDEAGNLNCDLKSFKFLRKPL